MRVAVPGEVRAPVLIPPPQSEPEAGLRSVGRRVSSFRNQVGFAPNQPKNSPTICREIHLYSNTVHYFLFSCGNRHSVVDWQDRPMHSLIGSDHSSCSSESKFFGIEFSDLHVSKEDSIKPRCYQLDSQLFKAKYFADEDSVLVPAYVAAIVDPSQ